MTLTRRQEELMRLRVVKGLTQQEAALAMCIAPGTAAAHAEAAIKKLGANSMVHAAYLWLLAKGRSTAGEVREKCVNCGEERQVEV